MPPYIRSIDVLGYENLLHFPHSAVFQFPPDDLLSIDEFQPRGVHVPIPLTGEAAEPDTRPEVDGQGIPTVDLGIDHYAPGSRSRRKAIDVVKLRPADAWQLGRDPEWVEPQGTCRGVYSREEPPWDRVMRALTQFLASRASSYGKAYISHDAEFRSVAGLHHHQGYEPHVPGGVLSGEALTEDVEGSAFVRDMEGAMKVYWTRVMGDAHGRIHRITAKESFEIINSFLHYLSHYEIFDPSEPFLRASLKRTTALSQTMLAQISVAQVLSDALPGNVVFSSWHAMALLAWVREPLVRDGAEWERNGEVMRRRVEATFTEARAESMARNSEPVPVPVPEPEAADEAKDSSQVGYAYDFEDQVPEHVAADWENANTSDRLTHAQAKETLAKTLEIDVDVYEAHGRLPLTTYTILGLSRERPRSVPAQRLDARFVSGVDRASDFFWLTLVSEAGEIVLLVDAKGLDLAQEMEGAAARGMGMRLLVLSIGKGGEETPLVYAVEGIVPRF